MNESGWNLRQAEVSQRNDVYGESIDTLIFDPDGMMRVQFGESEDLLSDPDSEFGSVVNTQDQERVPFTDEFGVRRSNDAKYRKLQFFLGDQWYPCIDIVSSDSGITLDAPSIRIDRTEVQLEFRTDDIAIVHRTRGLRSNDNRGRTFYFPIREELVYAKRIIANVMRVSSFQAAFGAIRTLLGGNSADALKCWARQQENASSTANSDTIDVPAPGVLTTTSNVKWEFPDTGAGLVNHMEILAGVLRTCASGANMPEFMLTADVSAGNFSSTLVSEGPFHKSMQWEQSQMIAEDIKVYMAALRYAAQSRKFGFSLRDLRNVRLDVRPPRVQTRNRQEDFDIASTLNDKGYLSAKTLTQSEQYDYESEQAQRAREIPVEQPLPLGSALHSKLSMPGPLPGKNGDPMKEPGVSKGNPEKIVKV